MGGPRVVCKAGPNGRSRPSCERCSRTSARTSLTAGPAGHRWGLRYALVPGSSDCRVYQPRGSCLGPKPLCHHQGHGFHTPSKPGIGKRRVIIFSFPSISRTAPFSPRWTGNGSSAVPQIAENWRSPPRDSGCAPITPTLARIRGPHASPVRPLSAKARRERPWRGVMA